MHTAILRFFPALLLLLFSAEALQAQAFNFGKNRVQYETFDWRIIQSDHFDIYYYDSRNYLLAEFTAHSLEAAYQQLAVDFNHQINERIRVIIYDSHASFSQTNVVQLPVNAQGIGGVTDLFKNRITMPFMADYGQYRRVLQHELVHAMVNDMFYGGNINALLAEGRRIFPLWAEEGLAEYVSQGWDTETDMFLRDATINNYLPPIQFLGGFFAYRGGQGVWDFIVQEYGREKIAEIFDRMKLNRNFELSMRQSTGLTIDELSERWKDWLQRKYFPEVTDRENLRNIGTNITRSEFRGSYNTSPALSPQGDRIAMITNRRGFFDVVVIDANTGRLIKTLIRGEDNVNFEELNILQPNLSWSPDGRQIALSTTSRGRNDIAIVDYESGRLQKIEFPNLNSIRSVAWSPDGSKIAFQGTEGSFINIYVYELETGDFINVTNDIFSDSDPAWSNDSQAVLFSSDRGPRIELGVHRESYFMLANPNLHQTDIYMVRLGDDRATRLTNTPDWNETSPQMTRDGRILYVSDQNGINNIYTMNLQTRVSRPLTDLITGVMQMSVTPDGTKAAVNSINQGFLDIFVINNPLERVKPGNLRPNQWAQRRAREREEQRVPAVGFSRNIFVSEFREDGFTADLPQEDVEVIVTSPDEQDEPRRRDIIDFRNYQFSDDLEDEFEDTSREVLFSPTDNRTDDGLFIPKRYRLEFSPDFAQGSAGGTIGSQFGAFSFIQASVSDVLGDHRLTFAGNLVFDLRNASYFVQYAYLRNRTNYFTSFVHNGFAFQTFGGQLVRYRIYSGDFGISYPLNRFERLEFSQAFIGLSRDLSSIQIGTQSSLERDFIIYPQVRYVRDVTIPGFLSPQKGHRLAVEFSGGVPVSDAFLGFASLTGDARQYFSLGNRYSFALRASGGMSFGPDPQNFLLGGVSNWINFRQDQRLTAENLANVFFTLPALPMRGWNLNAGIGDKFALGNAEFRFPLVAALVPGPLPLFPLFNIQGTAFVDVGATWTGENFNDLLVGTGFGLRTILFGLPFRYDIAWPYSEPIYDGFGSRVHYFSIGLDF
ncbi:MAG: PD40 domain-containing protein [Balneolales bacterium]|nr:PD40 domain-containing protein [Balneolales bacterium]